MILTVSELNKKTKHFLEKGFSSVQVKGEISNLTKPASKHLYFTLKDNSAQVKCAYFRHSQNNLSHSLENGQSVILVGKVTLYEARGDYQIIVSNMIPDGEGILLQKIEHLKKKLKDEGLFDQSKKKPIPQRPQKIGVITSDSGAAVHDILTTLKKRYPLARVTLYCCEVQGTLAETTIISAFKTAVIDRSNDVLIIARGGGSLEDLMAFNSEQLAREIFQSPIPVICGIGHETDITICDFVADLRVATPTAAAQSCCPDMTNLQQDISRHKARLKQLMGQILSSYRQSVGWLIKQILAPASLMFNQRWQSLDYKQMRMTQAQNRIIAEKQKDINIRLQHIYNFFPKQIIQQHKHQLSIMLLRFQKTSANILIGRKQSLEKLMVTLHTLSPLATLNRGYCIASYHGKVITILSQVNTGNVIEVRLKHGALSCSVLHKEKIND